MLGFVACLGASFKGDIIVQFAKAPLGTIVTLLLVAAATLVPRLEPRVGRAPAAAAPARPSRRRR